MQTLKLIALGNFTITQTHGPKTSKDKNIYSGAQKTDTNNKNASVVFSNSLMIKINNLIN